MGKRKLENQALGEAADQEPVEASVPGGAATPATLPEEEVRRLTEEVEKVRDQHLRLAAEFDNYRKRVARERGEYRTGGRAEVVTVLLDAIDDLNRFAGLDPEQTSAADVVAGVALVERKIGRELETMGLERLGRVGEAFDPSMHEAVATVLAESEDQDQTVAAVFQTGYRFAGQLLRPARVQVRVWSSAPQ